MDPDELQMLLEAIQAQYAARGGGYLGADPYAPQGGFPAPPMPNGKMPQYRTQGSGFVSDGTVRDYVGMALPDTDKFSPDALINADPALKPLLARAVGEAGHDPYAAYAAFDDDEYRQALVNMALGEIGVDAPFSAANITGKDGDGDGKVDEGMSWTNDEAIADIIAKLGNGKTAVGSGFVDPLSGREFQESSTYEEALRQKLGAYQGALDNFITQAAPTIERNTNDINTAAGAFGGMPFPAQAGVEDFSYQGAGPGFNGGGGRQVQPARDPGMLDNGRFSRTDYAMDWIQAYQEDERARALGEVLRQVAPRRSSGRNPGQQRLDALRTQARRRSSGPTTSRPAVPRGR